MSRATLQQELRDAQRALEQHEQTLAALQQVRQQLCRSLDAQSSNVVVGHSIMHHDALVQNMWKALQTAQTQTDTRKRADEIRAALNAGASLEDELRRKIGAHKVTIQKLFARAS